MLSPCIYLYRCVLNLHFSTGARKDKFLNLFYQKGVEQEFLVYLFCLSEISLEKGKKCTFKFRLYTTQDIVRLFSFTSLCRGCSDCERKKGGLQLIERQDRFWCERHIDFLPSNPSNCITLLSRVISSLVFQFYWSNINCITASYTEIFCALHTLCYLYIGEILISIPQRYE